MSKLTERLDTLRTLIQEPEFLEGKGLSNEVNIRIFCYNPKDEMIIRHFTEKLMADQSLKCHLIEYNLYKFSFPSVTISASLIASRSKKRKRENSLYWIR